MMEPLINIVSNSYLGCKGLLVFTVNWTADRAANLTKTVLVDISALNPAPIGLKIQKITGIMSGSITAKLEFYNRNNNKSVLVDDFVSSYNPEIKKDYTHGISGGIVDPRSYTLSDCETVGWVASTSVSFVFDGTNYVEGARSSKFIIADAFTTGLVAYQVIQPDQDVQDYHKIGIGIRSSVALQPGDLSLLICETSNGTGAASTLPIGMALAADTWYWMELSMDNTPASRAQVRSIGLYANRDFGAADINLDGIKAIKSKDGDTGYTGDLVISTTGSATGEALSMNIEYKGIYSQAKR